MIALRTTQFKSQMYSEIVEARRIEIKEKTCMLHFETFIFCGSVPTLVSSVGPENRSARPESHGAQRGSRRKRSSRRQKFCEDELLATLQFPPLAEIERNVACAVRSPREYKRAQLAQRERAENFVS